MMKKGIAFRNTGQNNSNVSSALLFLICNPNEAASARNLQSDTVDHNLVLNCINSVERLDTGT